MDHRILLRVLAGYLTQENKESTVHTYVLVQTEKIDRLRERKDEEFLCSSSEQRHCRLIRLHGL